MRASTSRIGSGMAFRRPPRITTVSLVVIRLISALQRSAQPGDLTARSAYLIATTKPICELNAPFQIKQQPGGHQLRGRRSSCRRPTWTMQDPILDVLEFYLRLLFLDFGPGKLIQGIPIESLDGCQTGIANILWTGLIAELNVPRVCTLWFNQ